MNKPPEGPGEGGAGWYPDPDGDSTERFWNGSQWTDTVRPAHPATPIGPVTHEPARPRFCPNCGAPLGAAPANFCGRCGARVVPTSQTSPTPGPVGEPATPTRRTPPQRSLRDNTLALTAIVVAIFAVVALTIAAVSQRNARHLSSEERNNLVAYFDGLGDNYLGVSAKEATCTVMYEGFQSYPQGDPDVWWRDIATYAGAETVSPSAVRQALAELCRPYADTSYQGNAKDASTRD